MKKALIYDPYIDTLGGGERYSLTFALSLIKLGYTVELAWSGLKELVVAEHRFGMDLGKITLNTAAYKLFSEKDSLKDKYLLTKEFDLIFWVSDGSLPLLFSKNNLVHFQVPFKNIGGNPLINRLKIATIHKFVYNSEFTKKVHEKHFPKNKSFVLYPPIDTDNFKPGKKENLILSVGRFDSPSHSKRQDVLIEAFRKLIEATKGYKLILAGGLMGDDKPIKLLKEKAKGLPVEIIVKPDFDKLKNLFSNAKFFWHAAGYGVDEARDPEKVEHFGMTTVEAMSAGCVPVVIDKGGQKEIITKGTGFLCRDLEEMVEVTTTLIKSPNQIVEISNSAIARSKDFSEQKFYEKIRQLLR